MWRVVLAALVGYVVVLVWTMVTMSLSWLALGADFAFVEGSTATTTGWALISLVLGLAGAVLAGWVAAKVAKSMSGASAFAGLLFSLGILFAFSVTFGGEPKTLNADELAALGTFEAAGAAVQPLWYVWLLPFVGVAGAYLGGMCAKVKA